jgi:hypothetical protein
MPFIPVLIFAFSLLCPEGALASGSKAQKINRETASKMPSRVLSFLCRESPDSSEGAIGMAHMSIDLRDSTLGAFSMSLYLRSPDGYQARTLSGTYTTVPGGFIFRTRWQGPSSNFVLIHLHPGDKTLFPGLPKQSCELSGQLESQ